jgi:hypothetical protein
VTDASCRSRGFAFTSREPLIFPHFSDVIQIFHRLQIVCVVFAEDDAICFDFLERQIILQDLFAKLSTGLHFGRPCFPDQFLNPNMSKAVSESVFRQAASPRPIFPKDKPIALL